MTAGQITRYCTFGLIIGFGVGLAIEILFIMFGYARPGYLKFIFPVALTVVCLAYRIIHDRVFMKDYKKEVDERLRRMHW